MCFIPEARRSIFRGDIYAYDGEDGEGEVAADWARIRTLIKVGRKLGDLDQILCTAAFPDNHISNASLSRLPLLHTTSSITTPHSSNYNNMADLQPPKQHSEDPGAHELEGILSHPLTTYTSIHTH